MNNVSLKVSDGRRRQPLADEDLSDDAPTATLIQGVDTHNLVDLIAERVVGEVLAQIPAAFDKMLCDALDKSRPELLVDAKQMGQLTGQSRTTIDRMAKSGRIPVINSDAGRRFRPEEVVAAMVAESEKISLLRAGVGGQSSSERPRESGAASRN